jgi:23S rRNA (uracil1939-C5)-methyltransferase
VARRRAKPQIAEQLEVKDYAAEGKSLGYYNNKVVFVENSIPGDIADVLLYKNKKDWAEGYIIKMHQPSPLRMPAFCSHFGICGGCQWQNLPYQYQLQYKQKQVYDQLKRIGGLALPEIMPIIGSQQTQAYRNKLEFTYSTRRYLTKEELNNPEVNGNGAFGGFHARGIFDKIVNIDTCYLMQEPANIIREALKKITLDLGMPFYDINQHAGWLRNVQMRICTTNDIMVNVMVGYDSPALKPLLDGLLQQVPQITTLYYTINPKRNDSIYDLEPQLYFGPANAIEKLENLSFKISPKSFFQTNTKQAENLYAVTRDFAELNNTQTVYDLYCGTGSIGIFVSNLAAKVIGVELIDAAIYDAKENATLNNINNCSFFAGDVIKIVNNDFFETHGKPDVIITDPPRAGMHEKLVNKILDMEAPIVVYVSCNPATQARDLRLMNHKYEVTKVQPVDMFPHTHHIENVVQLKLRKTFLTPANATEADDENTEE